MARIPTTQDISWFLDLKEGGRLNLDPPYQRRSVWSPRDKRYFIDTILNNYPAPPIFLHKTIDDSGHQTFHVVDGKQRLQTILDFTEDKIPIPDDFTDVNLRKKRWSELERPAKERFWNYVLTVEMLPDVSDAPIRNVFDRINRNSRKLTPQEMRHAKYDGWFIRFVETEAEKPEWKSFGVVTAARTKRMADVQFISELFAVILKGEILGFDQDGLDEIYAEYDDIEDNPELAMSVEDDFTKAVETTKDSIAEIQGLMPDLGRYLKVQSHFYTLWAYLYLQRGRHLHNRAFALRYKDFLDDVSEILSVQEGQVEEMNESNEQNRDYPHSAVLGYANNVRGASTDLMPRRRRFDALVEAMNGQAVLSHENS